MDAAIPRNALVATNEKKRWCIFGCRRLDHCIENVLGLPMGMYSDTGVNGGGQPAGKGWSNTDGNGSHVDKNWVYL